MIGWELQCRISDGTTKWLPLKDVKESNPIEAAQYTADASLAKESTFAWWSYAHCASNIA